MKLDLYKKDQDDKKNENYEDSNEDDENEYYQITVGACFESRVHKLKENPYIDIDKEE